MAIEIVDLPINSMVDLSIVMLGRLPEGSWIFMRILRTRKWIFLMIFAECWNCCPPHMIQEIPSAHQTWLLNIHHDFR